MRLRALLLLGAGALTTTPSLAADAPSIPLLQGTVYTYAASFPKGDEEHIVTLTKLDDAEASFSIEFRATGNREDQPEAIRFVRRVRRQDLLTGNRVNEVFQTGDAELFPGSSFLHLSAAALQTLRRGESLPFVLGTIKDYQGMSSDSLFALLPSGRKYFRGPLQRLGSATVPLAVLVNGERQWLPSIETQGRLSVANETVEAHRWWLDDPLNALSLKSGNGQLVRIDFPQPAPEMDLARSLSTGDCRAPLPGIYFDTASATLLPQSEAALATVARLLKANPGWTLTVEGHTDNVGTDAYNLDLSKRRAAAVQAALQSRHAIGGKQLSAEGFGAGRPVQDNSTLEGRAANRRVELLRGCR